MKPLRIAVVGCTGRMGTELIRLAAPDPAFQIVAALTENGDARLGQDAGRAAGIEPLEVPIPEHHHAGCDVVIDFSLPAGCRQWASWCAGNGAACVSGSTGLTAADRAVLDETAKKVPVLWAPNMSVGVNLLLKLVAAVAAAGGAGWDIEISETHHRHKVDAPSGTANALLDSIREAAASGAWPGARDQRGTRRPAAVYGRSGQCGPRGVGELGVHALRMGDIVGEHEVHFATEGEMLTLRHRALSRQTFAAGALRAARWIHGRAPGLYSMRDVLAGDRE